MPRRWNCRLRELECMGHTNRMYDLQYKYPKHRLFIHGLEDFYASPGANDFLGCSVGDIMSRCALDITSSSATPDSTLYHGAIEPRLSKIPAPSPSQRQNAQRARNSIEPVHTGPSPTGQWRRGDSVASAPNERFPHRRTMDRPRLVKPAAWRAPANMTEHDGCLPGRGGWRAS